MAYVTSMQRGRAVGESQPPLSPTWLWWSVLVLGGTGLYFALKTRQRYGGYK